MADHRSCLGELETLPECGIWYTVLSTVGISRSDGGGAEAYSPSRSNAAWKQSMRPNVMALENFMQEHGIRLRCSIPNCNGQGSYADHCTSTSNDHYNNLLRYFPGIQSGRSIIELKECAWEQMNIQGGAIRWNHLDGTLLMYRGQPPMPRPPSFGEVAARGNGPIHTADSINTPPQSLLQVPGTQGHSLADPFSGVMSIVDLPKLSTWYRVKGPCSSPVELGGDGSSLPHFSGGEKNWATQMKPHSVEAVRVLNMHRVAAHSFTCKVCPQFHLSTCEWGEHILDSLHYTAIDKALGVRPIVLAKSEFWQTWNVEQPDRALCGTIGFNHLDGELLIRRVDSVFSKC